MSNTQPIETSIEESAEDRKKRKAREASAAYRTRKAEKTREAIEVVTGALVATAARAVEPDPNVDVPNDPAEVARIEEGIKAALAEAEVLGALDEAIDIVHAGDDEDIAPSPTDYRRQDDDEIGKVIQMADHDPTIRDRTRAFLHPATPETRLRSDYRAALDANQMVAETLYRQAMNAKKSGNRRGKGRKMTDGEMADYARTVMELRPGTFFTWEQEIAYWVENISLTAPRWQIAWAAAGGTFEKAPRLRKA